MRQRNEFLSKSRSLIGSAVLTLALTATGAAGTHNHNYTRYVAPPNGFDDTGPLQDALHDCATNHQSGCTIQLTAGTYLSKPLEVSDFHGTVAGKGMDVTTIEALTPFPERWPTLLTFTRGDITISDMSFKVTAYQPVVPCNPATDFCGLSALVLITGHTSANASFERVAFEGAPGPDWGFGIYNLYAGVLFQGVDWPNQSFGGNFQMSGCRSRNSSENMRAYGVVDSHVTIGGWPKNGNAFENAVIGVFVVDVARSVIQVSDNTLTTAAGESPYYGGIWLLQSADYLHDPSQFVVERNSINTAHGDNTGLQFVDETYFFLGAKPSRFWIWKNDVVSDNPSVGDYGAINTWAAVGAIISENRTSGKQSYGISAYAVDHCLLIANDFRNYDAHHADIGLLTDTEINGDFPTTNSTVILRRSTDTVCDDGVGNVGNVVIGGRKVNCNHAETATMDVTKSKRERLKDERALRAAPVR